jgi:hypothetical protein
MRQASQPRALEIADAMFQVNFKMPLQTAFVVLLSGVENLAHVFFPARQLQFLLHSPVKVLSHAVIRIPLPCQARSSNDHILGGFQTVPSVYMKLGILRSFYGYS